MYGGDPYPLPVFCNASNAECHVQTFTKWNVKKDGNIECAPKELGGCGECVLELKRMLPIGRIPNLISKAHHMLKRFCNIEDEWNVEEAMSSCKTDNTIYCPMSSDLTKEGLFEFQKHWRNAEPVIVRDVLRQGTGLSWEPMVTYRALCGNSALGDNSNDSSQITAIDCLSGCEVNILTHTTEVKLTDDQYSAIRKVKRANLAQDKKEGRAQNNKGVEPWTFEQKLGEAVFIPAGCPHQVRNLKSCTKVAVDFVSPENVHICMLLTDEFRRLPKNHKAREDKLEIKKMIVFSVDQAVKELEAFI
ncbi:hypothetical protein TSUD_242100 [Trifolium subterraneum]|uniref:JmjC domain-containing protein n=1 Tax=Trifolium subterraneum TaxID=3900 RepID=A0A2Z6MXD7_TRISU|nr:hypothetical protein TSUD_242100 [Trifolium subterraneum]